MPLWAWQTLVRRTTAFSAFRRVGCSHCLLRCASVCSLTHPGAQVEVTEREDGVIELRPRVPIPASQAWFWTDAWQARERQVDEDLAAGRVTSYDDGESFLASLSD